MPRSNSRPATTPAARALAALLLVAATSGCRSAAETEEQPLLLFPPPPAQPRVQFLTWATGAREVEEPMTWFDELLLGDDPAVQAQAIVKPYGVAARDGVVYVCDTKGYNLSRLDFKNHTFTRLGMRGVERLRKPLNVVIDDLGYKFVVDSYRKQVVVFGPDDAYVTGLDVPEPCHPVDVAVHGNELYVLDNDDDPQIVVMERTSGEVLRTIGSGGSEPGQFTKPSSLCVDRDGFIYVSDSFNYRIQKLTNEGEPVWQRGSPGRRLGQFGRPRGIRVGPDGIVYLVEGAMQLVQMFDSDGNVLMRFGGPGNVPGGMVLPSTLAIDETSIPYFEQYIHPDFDVAYLLFVANQYGSHLINVYAFGSFPEGYRFQTSKIAELPQIDESTGIAPVEENTPIPPPDDAGAEETAPGSDAGASAPPGESEGTD